jgi:hypothetical protein
VRLALDEPIDRAAYLAPMAARVPGARRARVERVQGLKYRVTSVHGAQPIEFGGVLLAAIVWAMSLMMSLDAMARPIRGVGAWRA